MAKVLKVMGQHLNSYYNTSQGHFSTSTNIIVIIYGSAMVAMCIMIHLSVTVATLIKVERWLDRYRKMHGERLDFKA